MSAYFEQELAALLRIIDPEFTEEICFSQIDTDKIDDCVALLKGIYAEGVQFANNCHKGG